ncbi:V-type ATP synthase subunit B [archaeon]|nr:V-type ATP synthase subunit B [archaeon]
MVNRLKEYQTLSKITGPLIVVEGIKDVGYRELVTVILKDGTERTGQVLELKGDTAVIEVFEGTAGIGIKDTKVRFLGKGFTIGVSKDMVGGIFDGLGRPKNMKLIPEKRIDINGMPINPYSRDVPKAFIETGFSAIDGLLSLIRGQKLPIFSESGVPHNQLAAGIAKNIKSDLVIFAAIGVTNDELNYFITEFEKTGALENIIVFANLASDPVIERIVTPRAALTAAEYFAWEHDRNVVVILSDMTNYANALREISASKEEVPSRRGYPPYLYSDLASIYERTGRIKGKEGSITQIPILTMPEGDITHPIPDLTGYITEGQIMLSPAYHRKGIFPPINIIPSLSRMMHHGIGLHLTREDHRQVSNQIYAFYSKGKKLEQLKSIIGEDALSDIDKRYLKFASSLEEQFISQKKRRSIKETLNLAWKLLMILPKEELTKIDKDMIEKYWYDTHDE